MKLLKLLEEKNLTVTTVESCTGGLIGGAITSVPGASKYYKMGFITYSNEAKEKLVGVSHETLEKYGAVSPQTAREMSLGGMKAAGADIAISVTGFAGPDGEDVGLIYIGVNGEVKKLNLTGTREEIRKKIVEKAIEFAENFLLTYRQK